MNKTVTINISGIIFHIEENAYEILQKYLGTIRGYFNDTEGRDEIMADIEARIAELLGEKTSPLKQVVLMQDVEEVMQVMGRPEDFAGENAEQKKNDEPEAEKKNDPSKENSQDGKQRRRRVFRDPDNKMLGGVCSGIASYFDMDPLWLRLAFVAIVLLGGAGILFYIILWIVIPKATTTAEKLEMRGEEVNINNIKRSFDEEMDHMKKKMKDFEKEAKEFGGSFKKDGKRRDGLERFSDFIISIFGTAFKIVGKIFAFFLIIVCAVLIIALLASLFGIGIIDNISINHLSDLVFSSSGQSDIALVGILLAAGIPLLMLIYTAIRSLIGIRTKNRAVSISSTSLWVLGIMLLVYVGCSVGSDFSERAHVSSETTLQHTKCDTLFLQSVNNYSDATDVFDMENSDRWTIASEKNGQMMLCYPEMKILKSEDDSFHLLVTTYARGFDHGIAQVRAKKIKYEVTQKDSLLLFPRAFGIDHTDKWRDQEVRIVLYVPENKMIYLASNMKNILYNVDNLSDTWDHDMVDRRWVMQRNGLSCVDCDGLKEPKRNKKKHE